MAQRNDIKDFIRHARCINYYTRKEVWVSEQGRHYHLAGCGTIDDSCGPYKEVEYHKDLANGSGLQYSPCTCAF